MIAWIVYETNQQENPRVSASLSSTAASLKESAKPIILVSYPEDRVILYPTYIAAIIASLAAWYLGEERSSSTQVLGIVFLAIMGVNMVVLAFDFPRTTSLNLFFVTLVIIMGTILTSIYMPTLLPALSNVLKRINPYANAWFYFGFVIIMTLLYIAMMINIRFDYWEVRPNELLHHHGFLSNLERYSAPNMRISKEIDDVFEYMLLRSGRLIIHPSNGTASVHPGNRPGHRPQGRAVDHSNAGSLAGPGPRRNPTFGVVASYLPIVS